MNGKVEKALDGYSEIIFGSPIKFLSVVLLITFLIASQGSKVQTVDQQTEDFLPESEPVIQAFNVLDAEFSSGGSTSYTALIQPDPDHPNSDEIRDVRDPEMLRYLQTITNELEKVDRINSISSPANLFSEIPASKRETQETMDTLGEPRWSRTISKDYQAAKITVSTSGLTSEQQDQIGRTIKNIIDSRPLSSDLDISYSGQIFINQAFQNQSQNTMQLTSIVALLGVMLMVIYLFRSIYYGLNSLLTVVFGIAVGFGIYGILGFNITPQTSGAISLGIGIAVDFGIQPIARYREEREELKIEKALKETIKGVITPMTIGLFAANVGFMALAFGKLTFLADLGILLTLTTTVAYFSAFTVIPSALVIYDRYFTVGGTSGFTLSKILGNNTKGENKQK
jgi:predicted RND superfamily exporter protein